MQNDYKDKRDKLAMNDGKPDIKLLQHELQRSLYNGANIAKLNANDDMRLCRWEGQTEDGKKHSDYRQDQDPAMPFEGASDVRVRLADKIINELVAVKMAAWSKAKRKVNGVSADDAGVAGAASLLMSWILENKIGMEVRREAHLLAQYAEQYGWSVMHVGWDQQIGKRADNITLEQLAEIQATAEQTDPNTVLRGFCQNVMDESKDDFNANLIMSIVPIDEAQAKKMLKDIRETEKATVFFDSITRNLPIITALKPFDEIAFPPETIELEKSRIIFRRVFMTEVEIRSMVESDGWDQAFVDAVVETGGHHTWYNDPNIVPAAALLTNQQYRGNNLIEIVYSYARQIGEDGKPCIYYTIFNPFIQTDLCAKHERLAYQHGNYPFVPYRREHIRKIFCESRGVPEIVITDQAEIKAQHDSLRDRTAFETLPPIKVKKRNGYVGSIGPGMQLPVSTPDDYQFLEPPRGNPQLAFNLIETVKHNCAEYFGLQHPQIQPERTAMMQQVMIDNWLSAWARIYQQIFQLSLQYMDAAEIERITQSQLSQNSSDIASQFDFAVSFDVNELNPAWVSEKLSAITQFVIPLDSGGIIDRNKLITKICESISPDIAKEIVTDQATATQKLEKDVKTDLAIMMLGMEPQYVENDPTAQAKLQIMQQIMQQNPKAAMASQTDQTFGMIFQNYTKNLQMSIEQEKNKQIGRQGISPISGDLQEQTQMVNGQMPMMPQ
jgi:hypothetical protein